MAAFGATVAGAACAAGAWDCDPRNKYPIAKPTARQTIAMVYTCDARQAVAMGFSAAVSFGMSLNSCIASHERSIESCAFPSVTVPRLRFQHGSGLQLPSHELVIQ